MSDIAFVPSLIIDNMTMFERYFMVDKIKIGNRHNVLFLDVITNNSSTTTTTTTRLLVEY